MIGMNRQQAGRTFHHDAACIVHRLSNDGDTRRAEVHMKLQLANLGANPFSTSSRLACAAPAEHEPSPPWLTCRRILWRQLIAAAPDLPVSLKSVAVVARQCGHDLDEFIPLFAFAL